ncbi:hypothetical protein ANCCAN_26098 [Ancylostoma caninum]|uniref:Uncharacterized protein n=1 Tax=Ancylostoma caninum TaxID=29170 RepID=A0A368FBG4_ANCCA|nr:hypothetical protein ANCCAN_26098 [Ancylostoma caninum]
MEDLPECRVRNTRPFEHIGIDYFCPISTRENDINKKVHGTIVTCTTTRLLHLVSNMATTTLLHALRRFFAPRYP